MGTTAQRFFPTSLNWDGTDPASGDVRQLATASPGSSLNAGSCDFGTSGSKTITVDPYTTGRTTTGTDSGFGWAVHIDGANGMDSTATAKRIIPAGTWLFQGRLTAGTASLNAVTVGFNVYRVAAPPSTTRTLLFSDSVSAGLVATTPPTDFSRTTASQSEILLEADETIQVTYTLTATGQVGGLVINFFHGDLAGSNTTLLDVPSPGVRTEYLETVTASAVGVSALSVGAKTITGTVYDSDGNPANAATVKLFRQSDDVKISTDTTGADGVYLFTRADDDADQWYVVGFSDATHHGTTDRDLTAS